jgi:hypothetical protein
MKKNRFYFLVLMVVTLLSLVSCKTQRELTNPLYNDITHTFEKKDSVDLQKAEALLKTEKDKLMVKEITDLSAGFSSLSSKVSVIYGGNSFSGNIRIIKDSVIWLSIGKFGFEGVRALLTKDSIKVINKLEREYFSGDYVFLRDILGFSLSYDILQSMLLGEDFQSYADTGYVLKNNENRAELYFAERRHNSNQDLFPKLNQLIEYNTDLKYIERNYFLITDSKHKMDIHYNSYLSLPNIRLVETMRVLVFTGKTSIVEINFDKQRINDALDIPFTIPQGYSRM